MIFVLVRRTAKFFLLLFLTISFAPEIKSQPGGCSYATWQEEYCREERTAVIKKYETELKKLDGKISLEPRNAENFYRRGVIYTDITAKKLDAEFDGIRYFSDLDRKALADFTRAVNLDPKPQYYGSRAGIYQRFWENELKNFSYWRNGEHKSSTEIFQDINKFLLDNENFKIAEKDFLKCFDLTKGRGWRESIELCGGYVQMRQSRAFWLGHDKHVAALIGKSGAADIALADFDYSIKAEKGYSRSYNRDSSLAQVYLVDKARAAEKFGRSEAALEALNEAEKLLADGKSEFCKIYATRAAIFLSLGKIESVLKDADTAINGSEYWICQNLLEVRGDIYYSRGDIHKAIEDYSRLLKQDSTLLDKVYLKRGKLYLQTSDYEKAVADFTAAIGFGSLCEKDYQLRARAYRLAGDESAALEDDKKASGIINERKGRQTLDYCGHHQPR